MAKRPPQPETKNLSQVPEDTETPLPPVRYSTTKHPGSVFSAIIEIDGLGNYQMEGVFDDPAEAMDTAKDAFEPLETRFLKAGEAGEDIAHFDADGKLFTKTGT